MKTKEIEIKINAIESTGDYKVLEKLNVKTAENGNEIYNEYDGDEVCVGVFVDVETTGLDYKENEIIELGMVTFEYSKNSGKIYQILNQFDAFQEPSTPITAEITEITGITNEMVSGHSIDSKEVEDFISGAQLVIAHNSNFDRKFIEPKFPVFESKPWACSLEDVDWNAEGFRTRSLEFLAFKFGFVYDAHRADIDCLAGIQLLSKTFKKSGSFVMHSLLKSARQSKSLIQAIKAPFAAKDTLKERGYRWNADEKVWWIMVTGEASTKEELDYLNNEIYVQDKFRPDSIPTRTISSFNRYSIREQ